MEIDWQWQPSTKVGPFVFGVPVESYIDAFGLKKLEPDIPLAQWETFSIAEYESRLIVEHDAIAGVLCCDALVYNRVNILGLSADSLRGILGDESERDPDACLGGALYYDCLGATFWMYDGRVRSATCTPVNN